MKPFMNEDFLLSNDTACALYHGAAEAMPIIDYHCHLIPREIAQDRRFDSVTQLMLGGDHYKWRAMLSNGVDEALIRGDGDDLEKFKAYAHTVRRAVGNPLYHWTHLEFKRVFGIDDILNEDTAESIYHRCNELLKTPGYSAQGLIDRFHVETLCTTDDPIDDLAYHDQIAKSALKAKVLPAFRPDKAIHIDRVGAKEYLEKLSEVSGVEIRKTGDVVAALEKRVRYFDAHGAKISDHALDTVPYAAPDEHRADAALSAALRGEAPNDLDLECFKTALLVALGGVYKKFGWAQQYHIAAMRNNNARMFARYGADVGFDSINDAAIAPKLSRLLDAQDKLGALPPTVLYSLNPAANAVIGTMLGNFQESGVRGKMQMGSAWWFLDQRDGMEEQMRTLANLGMLSNFVGMLTDSRSLISYPRHEYFRRILCNLIGSWVENGEYPADLPFLEEMVKDICFYNAKRYFKL